MSNFNPLSSSVSFDDLLKANKQQFDKIFSDQIQELGLLGSSHRPPTNADLASASMASEAAARPSDIYAILNERFGSEWSSEVVEHKSRTRFGDRALQADGEWRLKDAVRIGPGQR